MGKWCSGANRCRSRLAPASLVACVLECGPSCGTALGGRKGGMPLAPIMGVPTPAKAARQRRTPRTGVDSERPSHFAPLSLTLITRAELGASAQAWRAIAGAAKPVAHAPSTQPASRRQYAFNLCCDTYAPLCSTRSNAGMRQHDGQNDKRISSSALVSPKFSNDLAA